MSLRLFTRIPWQTRAIQTGIFRVDRQLVIRKERSHRNSALKEAQDWKFPRFRENARFGAESGWHGSERQFVNDFVRLAYEQGVSDAGGMGDAGMMGGGQGGYTSWTGWQGNGQGISLDMIMQVLRQMV